MGKRLLEIETDSKAESNEPLDPDQKRQVIIEFGELFLKNLSNRLAYFKEMIESEID